MFSGLCGALPVNSGEVNLTRFSETFGVFSSLSLHFVLQQRQWGIQAKEAFWGKLLKKTKGGLFNWKLLGLTDTWGNHWRIQVSSLFVNFLSNIPIFEDFLLVECCTFFESAIALFQKIAGDLVFSLIPILFIESSTSPLAISLMELRRIQFSVKLSKQKKKKEKM